MKKSKYRIINFSNDTVITFRKASDVSLWFWGKLLTNKAVIKTEYDDSNPRLITFPSSDIKDIKKFWKLLDNGTRNVIIALCC